MPLSPARWTALLLFACLVVPGVTQACSIKIAIEAFEPDVTRANHGVDLFHVPGPPALKVDVGAIRRTDPSVACDSEAEVELLLDWVEPTALRLQDVGFYWRQVAGATSVDAFGGSPYKTEYKNGHQVLTLRVGDHPSGGVLDFDVEVRAIDAGLRLGPPTRVHVHSGANPTQRFESHLRWMDEYITRMPSAIPHAELAEKLTGFMERDQLKRVRTGVLVLAPCGPYRPYRCGATETALLKTGERPALYANEALEPTACVGIRQALDRVIRVEFVGAGMLTRIASAEVLTGAQAATWASVAATCST